VSLLSQPVADAAHGLDRVGAERPVDLLAQVPDVDVDDVRTALERKVPRSVEELGARQRDAGAAHEHLEESELLRAQVELTVAAPRLVRGRVETQRPDLEHGGPFRGRPAREGAEAGEQLVEGEGLRQVVVGSRIEPAHAILDRVTRGQHQDRRPDPVLAEPAADVEAVDARQHHVEDDRVVVDGLRHPESGFPAVRHVGRVPLLAQPAAEQLAELLLVLDHEHAHASIVARRMRGGLATGSCSPNPSRSRSLRRMAVGR
jgi:hypothetical protein